ncbi:MAG: hypothetical protein KatS3mg035_0357 [Bacteroidia bacterium]|nr:MAG: hypothetical protein KatS3mg035_0357 [Bacteroidia bacterium]
MKTALALFFAFIITFQAKSQTADCALVSYKNYKKNEKGVIAFCFNNSNTLMVNNYTISDQELISALLITPNGVEMRECEASWKKDYKPMVDMPSEKSSDFQGYKVQFVKLTDGTQTAKIWFTKDIKFFNSQNYWLFYGALGQQIQEKYADQFPVALQLSENSSGKTMYEHTLIEKTNIPIKSEVFKPLR